MADSLASLADAFQVPLDFHPDGRRTPLLPLVSEAEASKEVRVVFEDAKDFYRMEVAPGVFRLLAGDPKRLEASWERARVAFEDGHLDRLSKELVAVAVSVSARSPYGMDFHLREARRLGASEQAIWEALRVAEHFTILNRVADGLDLDNDFAAAL